MRFATIAAFAASAVVVSAQGAPDLSQVPQCAVPCLVSAIPESGCGVSDLKCQCTTGQQKIADSVLKCVPSKCSKEDQAKLAPVLAGLCEKAGVSVTATAGATAAASGSGSASATASGSASKTASGSASASTSAPAESTGGAASNMAGLGAVALGLALAL